MSADGEVLVRPSDDPVVRAVAGLVAGALGIEVRPVRREAAGDGRALARDLDRGRALTVVSLADGVGWTLAQEAGKPVLLVPTALGTAPSRLRRILVPLDGSPASAAALPAAAPFLTDELVVLHVFDPAVPRFWDHPAHAEHAWSSEFRARWCDRPGTRVELRTGRAPEQVLEVARDVGADLVVLGWSQRLGGGHAALVRRAVADSTAPVLLVPVGGGEP